MTQSHAHQYGGRGWGVRDGLPIQWLAGFVYERGKIIGSSNNSSGVVARALVCGTECSGFEFRFML